MVLSKDKNKSRWSEALKPGALSLPILGMLALVGLAACGGANTGVRQTRELSVEPPFVAQRHVPDASLPDDLFHGVHQGHLQIPVVIAADGRLDCHLTDGKMLRPSQGQAYEPMSKIEFRGTPACSINVSELEAVWNPVTLAEPNQRAQVDW